jgi:sugar phosphate isomerase/epimerase
VKTGFHSGAFAADPIAEVIPRLAALGFQGVELNAETAPWTRPHVTPRLGTKKRAEIRRLAGDHGLEVSAISAHISLVDADRRTRQRHLGFVKGCIDLAPDVGTNIVHAIGSGPGDGCSRPWTRAFDTRRTGACRSPSRPSS